jgi:hypothetical protein
LIASTLGDCFSRNPDYVPRASANGLFDSATDLVVDPIDPMVRGKSAKDILIDVIAGMGKCARGISDSSTGCPKAITCREWMLDELNDP